MKWARLLWVLVIITGAADVATTTYGIEYSDHISEGNPTVEQAMESHGTIIGHVLLKATAVLLFGTFAIIAPSRYRHLTAVPPILLWGTATVWNLALIV